MLLYFCLVVMLNLNFLLLLLLSVKATLQSSVSLTVEEGVSLVGPHCPGTVRLFCEGVDLTTFRWLYNGNINIGDFYDTDDSVTTPSSTSNPAFVSVQLTAVSQSLLNPVFGNFSSTLIVDLSQLEQQNIKNISCGSPATRETVPVDVHIAQETVPAEPQFKTLSVQLVTILDLKTFTVSISWMELQPVRCVQLLQIVSLIKFVTFLIGCCMP